MYGIDDLSNGGDLQCCDTAYLIGLWRKPLSDWSCKNSNNIRFLFKSENETKSWQVQLSAMFNVDGSNLSAAQPHRADHKFSRA